MSKINYLLVILDSVGYDVFVKAKANNLKRTTVKAVHSPACWTLPSLVSYLWSYPPIGEQRLFDWDPPKWAPEEFQNRGYLTAFFSGNPFVSMYMEGLRRKFNVFCDLGKKNCINEMIEKCLDFAKPPFFHVLHVMETHVPYYDGSTEYPKIYSYDPEVLAKVDVEKAVQQQIRSVEYVDKKLGKLFDMLPKPLAVIVTADHGEIHPHGHAPNKISFSEKVFEIPFTKFILGWF